MAAASFELHVYLYDSRAPNNGGLMMLVDPAHPQWRFIWDPARSRHTLNGSHGISPKEAASPAIQLSELFRCVKKSFGTIACVEVLPVAQQTKQALRVAATVLRDREREAVA